MELGNIGSIASILGLSVGLLAFVGMVYFNRKEIKELFLKVKQRKVDRFIAEYKFIKKISFRFAIAVFGLILKYIAILLITLTMILGGLVLICNIKTGTIKVDFFSLLLYVLLLVLVVYGFIAYSIIAKYVKYIGYYFFKEHCLSNLDKRIKKLKKKEKDEILKGIEDYKKTIK